jgi:hypothetical protein
VTVLILILFQIPFPPTSNSGCLPPPLEILNNIGLRDIFDFKEYTVESLASVAPQVTEDVSIPVLDRVMTAHCECVLVMFLMNKFEKSDAFEIGVSKSSCWPCTVYLEELGRFENLKISISSTHCKTYAGWQFPSTLQRHQPIYQRMMDRTEDRISEFLRSVEARRRSDSQYISSEDEDQDPGVFIKDLRALRAKELGME